MDRTSLRLGPPAGARVLIAGGYGGIGLELVSACLDLDLKVTVLDIPQAIEKRGFDKAVRSIAFDGRAPDSMTSAVAEAAKHNDVIDSFFFLSGFPIIPRRPLAEVGLDKWDELMAVNLRSAYVLINAATPLLRKAAAPTIVTVASSLAFQVMPGMGAYAASKGGLITLTKAFASELAPTIRVNSVAPGAVDTDFMAGGTGRVANPDDATWFETMRDKYTSMVPLGRVAVPLDVVGPMLFLSGPASSYMTGQVLHLNGGRLTP